MLSAQRPEAPGGHAAAHAPLAGRTGAPSHGADSRGRRRAAFGTGGESWADPRAPGGPEAPVPPSCGPRARRPRPRRGPSLPASSGVPVLRGAAGWASRRVTGRPADPGSPCLGRVRRAGGLSPGLGTRSAAVWRHPRACWRWGFRFRPDRKRKGDACAHVGMAGTGARGRILSLATYQPCALGRVSASSAVTRSK